MEENYLEIFPKRYKIWITVSIINTLLNVVCCCITFGIGAIPSMLGIVFAIVAKNDFDKGNLQKAEKVINASMVANIFALVISIIVTILKIVCYFTYGSLLGVTLFAGLLEYYNK